MINSLLNTLQPYLPEIYFGLLILGALFLIWLVIYAGLSVRRNLRRKTWTRAPQPVAISATDSPVYRQFLAFLKRGLNRIGILTQRWRGTVRWIQKNDMGASFMRTLEILKTYLNTHHPQYELPWYIMLGPEGAGKTQLLHDLPLERPVGRPDYPEDEESAKLNWSFFNQAVVLDLKGKLVLTKDQINSDQPSFDTVLKLLNHFRFKRPLDGLIIVLPTDELGLSKTVTAESITARIAYFHTQLGRLQNHLAMKVPVYVLVSKCDLIPGFKEMTTELGVDHFRDILGWSCPYGLEVSYSPRWNHDLFASLHQALNQLRARIITKGRRDVARHIEGNLIFPMEFNKLKEGLALSLSTLFRESVYHEAFFLRGVYFCGRSPHRETEDSPTLTSTPWPSVVPDAFENVSSMLQEKKQGRVLFLQDLFERKIFRESNLAQPVRGRLLASTRKLNQWKGVAAAVATIWTIGIWHAYKHFHEDIKTILPALRQIDTSLTALVKFPVENSDVKRQNYLLEQSDKILKNFTVIKVVDLKSHFLPASWFDDIEQKILQSVARGYNDIIFPTLYQALSKRIAETVTLMRESQGSKDQLQGVLNPLLRPSFQDLDRYVTQINQLEIFIDSYTKLNDTRSIKDFGALIRYLYGHSLPPQFFMDSGYYQDALSQAVIQPIDLTVYRQAAAEKLGTLYRNFLNDAFNQKDTLVVFESLAKKLTLLNDISILRTMSDKELRDIGDQTVLVADTLSSGQLGWIERNTFDPGPPFSTLLNHILQSTLFGSDVVDTLCQLADSEFIKYRLTLQKYQSPFTGPFFDTRQGQAIAAPSKGMIQFIDTLTTFLIEPFMKATAPQQFKMKIPPRKLLFWDDGILAKAVKVVEDYEGFMTHRLKNQPLALQTMMRHVAANSIQHKIINFMAEAQTFQDNPLEDSFGQRELIHNQVQNISVVTPLFVKLLGALHTQYTGIQNGQVRELLVRENYHLLTKIEKMLDHDNLYLTNDDAFDGWRGDQMVGLQAFGVHDINDMKSYLRAQRLRLQFLAKDLAEPILTLLSLGYLEDIPVDLPLAARWTRIIAVLEDYEKQSPSNALKGLEHFLTYDINEITLENCSLLRDKIEDSIGGDYFMQVRGQVAQTLLKRCQSLSQYEFSDRYNAAAQFFNTHLAGRFPFTLDHTQDPMGEADPQDVAAFYDLFDAIPGLPPRQGSREAQQTLIFLQDIRKLRPLIMAALDPGCEGASAPLTFEVTFRSDRAWEKGGDKIIDWRFSVGGQEIKFWQDRFQGQWHLGDPIHIDFKWAQDGENVPISDPRKPALSVAEGTATYTYTGRWSLLRLLKAHGITPKPEPGLIVAPQVQRLEFVLPTAFNPNQYRGREPLPVERRSEESRVYLRLALKESVKQEKEEPVLSTPNVAPAKSIGNKSLTSSTPMKGSKPSLLTVSRFPTQAPLLDKRQIFSRREKIR